MDFAHITRSIAEVRVYYITQTLLWPVNSDFVNYKKEKRNRPRILANDNILSKTSVHELEIFFEYN